MIPGIYPDGDTDYMNDLQHLSEEKYGPIFVTLNPPFEPNPDTVVGRYKYEHPVIDSEVRLFSTCLFD